jgi:hypothetical protein
LFGLLGLFGFEAGLPCDLLFDLPCDFELDLPFVFEPAGHAPIVSPWRRCAATALWPTVIVTNGFFAECVWWQIVTLPVVVVVGVVVVVVPVVVLVEVVVVVGTVVDVVLVVVDVELVVDVLVVVDVDVLVLVDVVVVVEPVVVSCCEERTVGPRTPRAAATPIPQSSASASSVTAKRAVRRGRGFTGGPPGESGVSLSEIPPIGETCGPPPANHSFEEPVAHPPDVDHEGAAAVPDQLAA